MCAEKSLSPLYRISVTYFQGFPILCALDMFPARFLLGALTIYSFGTLFALPSESALVMTVLA